MIFGFARRPTKRFHDTLVKAELGGVRFDFLA
jgi:hypothetical protein